MKRVFTEEIISSIIALRMEGFRNLEIAERLELSVNSVRQYAANFAPPRWRKFTSEDDAAITGAYSGPYAVDLAELSRRLHRARATISVRAKALGVHKPNFPRAPEREAVYREAGAGLWAGRAHPAGMRGKAHSSETKALLSEQTRARNLAGGKFSRERRANIGKAQSLRLKARPETIYSRSNKGKRDDLGGQYFRSSWEANVARWLDFTGVRWEYEAKTFEFSQIKRGTRFYTPDFYLPEEERFIEVKGWWDEKSLTRRKRMAKYHPAVLIEYIDAPRYRAISASFSFLPFWENKGERAPSVAAPSASGANEATSHILAEIIRKRSSR